MRRLNPQLKPLVVALIVFVPVPTVAQVPPTGPDFEVAFTEDRTGSTVAIDGEGQFLAAWAENFGYVRACGYDRDGVWQGCLILDFPNFISTEPIHADVRGVDDFVVVWESFDSGEARHLIKGRRVAADGTPLGAEFEVTGSVLTAPRHPRVGFLPSDVLLTVWADDSSDGTDTSESSIQARYLTTGGVPLGDRFQVNTTTTGTQFFPEIAVATDGRFVVTWHSESSSGTDTSGWSVQAQRFSAGGAFAGDEFQVNTFTDGNQSAPVVAMGDDGSFVVAWSSPGSSGVDTDGFSIQARHFAANGSPLGDDIEVNSYTTGHQMSPSVGMMAGGAFEVTWTSDGSYGDDNDGASIQRQAFASDGSPSGSQLQVNTTIDGGQGGGDLSMNLDGDFVVVWNHDSGYAIRGRAFRSTIFSDGLESGDLSAWSLSVP